MSDILKKFLKYKGFIIFAAVTVALCMCINYICTWERQTKFEYGFISGINKNISKENGAEILRECKCFPVLRQGESTCFFDDGYGEGRSFGGNRHHEGIDIMPSEDKAGKFKVRSVCDGVVEKKGWLRLGGYRVGIRSRHGNYYYYAHLDSYRKGLKCNDTVKAGEIIGYMGNTGYGDEGTRGKFQVHLHFGVYVRDKAGEKSINTYYLLKKLESR